MMDLLNQKMYEALSAKPRAVLDSAKDQKPDGSSVFDAANDFADQDLRLSVVSAVNGWVETDNSELGEGETLADALNSALIDIVGPEGEELTDDEEELFEGVLDEAYDYLVSAGAKENDAEALLVDLDDESAQRIRDLLADSLPDGDGELDSVCEYVFGEPISEDQILDATYKKVAVVKNGKKVFRRKRISGTVRLSAKRKQAIKKMQLKAHTGSAKMHRKRSMAIRRKLGIKSLKRH